MPKVMHLNLRVDPTQYIPQIRDIPRYNYIHLVRQPKYMVNLPLLNENVHYLSEIFSPKQYVKKNKVDLLHAHHGQLGQLLLTFKEETSLPLVTSIRGRDATLANQPVGYLNSMKLLNEEAQLEIKDITPEYKGKSDQGRKTGQDQKRDLNGKKEHGHNKEHAGKKNNNHDRNKDHGQKKEHDRKKGSGRRK